jgi:hypothetical protein
MLRIPGFSGFLIEKPGRMILASRLARESSKKTDRSMGRQLINWRCTLAGGPSANWIFADRIMLRVYTPKITDRMKREDSAQLRAPRVGFIRGLRSTFSFYEKGKLGLVKIDRFRLPTKAKSKTPTCKTGT